MEQIKSLTVSREDFDFGSFSRFLSEGDTNQIKRQVSEVFKELSENEKSNFLANLGWAFHEGITQTTLYINTLLRTGLENREIRQLLIEGGGGYVLDFSILRSIELSDGLAALERLSIDLCQSGVELRQILPGIQHLPPDARRRMLRQLIKAGAKVETRDGNFLNLEILDELPSMDLLDPSYYRALIEEQLSRGDDATEIAEGFLKQGSQFFIPTMDLLHILLELGFHYESFSPESFANFINLTKDFKVKKPARIALARELSASHPDEWSEALKKRTALWSIHHDFEEMTHFFRTMQCLSEVAYQSLLRLPLGLTGFGARIPMANRLLKSFSSGLLELPAGGEDLIEALSAVVPPISKKSFSPSDFQELKDVADTGSIEQFQLRLSNVPKKFLESSNLYRELEALSLARNNQLKSAAEVFCSLNLTLVWDQYIPKKICFLAKENADTELVAKVRNHLSESTIRIDDRLLTVVARTSDPRDVEDLFGFLILVVHRFGLPDSRTLHSFAEKFQLAGRADFCSWIERQITDDDIGRYLHVLTCIIIAHLENNSLPDALQTLKRWSSRVTKDMDVTWIRERVRAIGDLAMIRSIEQVLQGEGKDSAVFNPIQVQHRSSLRSERIRDVAIAKAVKLIHEDTCQACGVVLSVPGGRISEAAHIQPLGSPYFGADLIENLLCLCPNHHSTFDSFGWFIDDDYLIVDTQSGTKSGMLRLNDNHPISKVCLRYRRRLTELHHPE